MATKFKKKIKNSYFFINVKSCTPPSPNRVAFFSYIHIPQFLADICMKVVLVRDIYEAKLKRQWDAIWRATGIFFIYLFILQYCT